MTSDRVAEGGVPSHTCLSTWPAACLMWSQLSPHEGGKCVAAEAVISAEDRAQGISCILFTGKLHYIKRNAAAAREGNEPPSN